MLKKSFVLPIALFFLTVVTTFLSGYLLSGTVRGGILFSASLIAILGAHEMGHYLYGRKYGVSISAPFFIPAPPFLSPIGTFGAFIRIKSVIRSRRELFDIGVAGPIAGVIVAFPVLFIGLTLSSIEPPDSVFLSQLGSAISLGESLAFLLFSEMTLGPVADGHQIVLHPVAFAGWIGLFITTLNLLPAGQLDGGHIAYCVFPERWYRVISRITIFFLVIMGMGTAPVLELSSRFGFPSPAELFPQWLVFDGWIGWIVWAFLLTLLGSFHPQTLCDDAPLSFQRKTVAVLCFIIFLACFAPVPISMLQF